MRIYIASSWRNQYYPQILDLLRDERHEVYDFKDEKTRFYWGDLDPEWGTWTQAQWFEAMKDSLAQRGFNADLGALTNCHVCVIVNPCNKSAHLEGGFAKGLGKRLIIYSPEEMEPELMYCMADHLVDCSHDLLQVLDDIKMGRFMR